MDLTLPFRYKVFQTPKSEDICISSVCRGMGRRDMANVQFSWGGGGLGGCSIWIIQCSAYMFYLVIHIIFFFSHALRS